MTKDQRYDKNQEGKEAVDRVEDQEVITNLVERFGRGEITLSEMWRQIDELLDAQKFRHHLTEPMDFSSAFPSKVGH